MEKDTSCYLLHGVKGPSRRGQGSPRREVQAQMDSSTDVRLYPPYSQKEKLMTISRPYFKQPYRI